MTDVLTGRELVEKTFVYMTNLSRECRKVLTQRFGQEHKGIPFDNVEPTMRKEIENWFSEREKNISITHERSNPGRPGEVNLTYSGASKDARFKFHVNALFSVTGPSSTSPCYLKTINVSVDKREFSR